MSKVWTATHLRGAARNALDAFDRVLVNPRLFTSVHVLGILPYVKESSSHERAGRVNTLVSEKGSIQSLSLPLPCTFPSLPISLFPFPTSLPDLSSRL